MATVERTKKQIKERIQKIREAMKTKQKGTPEYAQAVANLNKNRALLGKPPLRARDIDLNRGDDDMQASPASYSTGDLNTGLKGKTDNLLNAQKEVADLKANQDVQLGTAGTQENAFGTQEITRDPVTGEVIQKQKLSGDQQKILDQGEQLTQTGQNLAQGTLSQFQAGFNPATAQRTTSGNLEADRARIEDQVFGRLTRGMDEQKGNERQDLEQTLHNRGIPLGSKQFNDQMAEFDKRYDTRIADARAQATQMGGDEYSRNFGINEQLIANQISQGQSIRNQNLSEANALQGMGTGLMTPNFQGYQGTQYQAPDVLGAKGLTVQTQQGQQGLDIQQQNADTAAKAAAARNAGGGGSSGTVTKSPFNNTVAR